MRAAAPPQQAASERRCYKVLECVVVSAEGAAWQEALLIDQFSSICCFPPSFKRPFSSSFVFSRVSRAHRAAGGSLRSSLDRSWRCEAPSLLLGSFGPFSSLSFEAPSFAARLGGCAEASPSAGGAERRCYKVRETQPMDLRGADLFEEKAWMLSFFLACPSFLEAQ